MALPHFTSIRPIGGQGNPGVPPLPQEPVYLNLFEITIVLPTILTNQGRAADNLLTFQATNITLVTTPPIQMKDQQFKFTKRKFLTFPQDTSASFDIKFNVNVINNQYVMDTWSTLKAWYDLVWNSQTGYTHYKSDVIGTVIVNVHDKKGQVLRRVTYRNSQLASLSEMALDWTQGNIFEVTAKFESDYWDDEYYDIPINSSGTLPPTSGAPVVIPGYDGYQAFGQGDPV